MIFIDEVEIQDATNRDFMPTKSRIYGMAQAIRERLKENLSGSEITEKYYVQYSYDMGGLILERKL